MNLPEIIWGCPTWQAEPIPELSGVIMGRQPENKERRLADIPNQEGFQFLGVKKDGTLAACVVVKTDKGLHEIGGEALYPALRAWRPYPEKQA